MSLSPPRPPSPGQWYDEADGIEKANGTVLNTAFYGAYNTFRGQSTDTAYWNDAITYHTRLQATHFNDKHTYRLEWSPPEGGASSLGRAGRSASAAKAKSKIEVDNTGKVKRSVGAGPP